MQQCFSLLVCFFLDRNKNPNLDFLQQEKQKQNIKKKNTEQNLMEAKSLGEKKALWWWGWLWLTSSNDDS